MYVFIELSEIMPKQKVMCAVKSNRVFRRRTWLLGCDQRILFISQNNLFKLIRYPFDIKMLLSVAAGICGHRFLQRRRIV